MKSLGTGLLLLLFASSPAIALPPDSIGHIQTLKGTASIQRGDRNLRPSVGAAVFCGDLVRTGKDGAMGIVLTDDTTLSLGPDSRLVLKEYAFDPKEGKFALVARLFKGTFVYLSGLIGKLAPSSIRMEIPDATIAVRGTKLLISVGE